MIRKTINAIAMPARKPKGANRAAADWTNLDPALNNPNVPSNANARHITFWCLPSEIEGILDNPARKIPYNRINTKTILAKNIMLAFCIILNIISPERWNTLSTLLAAKAVLDSNRINIM